MADTSRRCDHCGCQAYWSTWIDLTELHWCNHFYRRCQVKIELASTLTIDHTWELYEGLNR